MVTPIRQLPAAPPKRRLPSLKAVLVGLGAVLAVNLLIVAAHTGGQGQASFGQPLPVEIEALVPVPGSVIRPQEDVGADLKDTYTGVLIIDQHRLPEDQLTRVIALGQVSFRPGANKDFLQLAPGNHSATILYWPQDKDERVAHSHTWKFTVG